MRRAGLYKELLSLRGLLADYEETANRESSRTAQKSEEAMASGFSMGNAGSASSSAVPTVDMSALDKSESECRLSVYVRDSGSASSSAVPSVDISALDESESECRLSVHVGDSGSASFLAVFSSGRVSF